MPIILFATRQLGDRSGYLSEELRKKYSSRILGSRLVARIWLAIQRWSTTFFLYVVCSEVLRGCILCNAKLFLSVEGFFGANIHYFFKHRGPEVLTLGRHRSTTYAGDLLLAVIAQKTGKITRVLVVQVMGRRCECRATSMYVSDVESQNPIRLYIQNYSTKPSGTFTNTFKFHPNNNFFFFSITSFCDYYWQWRSNRNVPFSLPCYMTKLFSQT